MDSSLLTPEILLQAYRMGVFPMAETRDDPEVFWVDPRRRGILPIDGFHISRSLARRLRRPDYHITVNQDFAGTVTGCADRAETWINDIIFSLYEELFNQGHAYSLEVRDLDNDLIGGVYGVSLGGAFFGESMFSRRTDASKIALAYLVDRLRATGYALFDTQFITPHLSSLGGQEIPRNQYHEFLEDALLKQADFTSYQTPTAQELLQRRTQTS